MRVESFHEFSARQGDDPIVVRAARRRVWSNGASAVQLPAGHFEFFEPPDNDYERLTLQIARQRELVERAHQVFTEQRQAAYVGGCEGAIPHIQELKETHDGEFRELQRLQKLLRATPEETARLKDLALGRELEQRRLVERGRAQAAIGAITLCDQTETGQHLDNEDE